MPSRISTSVRRLPKLSHPSTVLTIPVDVSVAGSTFYMSASPSLAHLIRRTAHDIPHPTKLNKTLWDAGEDLGPFRGPADLEVMAKFQEKQSKAMRQETGVFPLGSGSDFTVFLQRIGVGLPASWVAPPWLNLC